MIVEKIDLFSDWVEIVKTELESKGYIFNTSDPDEISIQYFNYLKRIIPPKPRNIKKSDVFNCPENLIEGLNLLESKIQNGEDISAHLSRKLKNLEEIDDLLYDWGIFHLHLGTTIEDDGYINRTGPLLFGYYDDENFYFINVMPHGSWTRQEILKTIYRNWPETFDKYRLKNENVVGLSHNVTDDEIKKLRNANINVLIEVEPGVIYVTPGGGFVSSGHSMEVVKQHMMNKKYLKQLEEQLKNDTETILKTCFNGNLDFITNDNLRFKMVKRNGRHFLVEENNNFELILNQ